jgi:hypothetical protein
MATNWQDWPWRSSPGIRKHQGDDGDRVRAAAHKSVAMIKNRG